jgi:lipopolysaccharide export LptBFGC system permease protein LptF
MERTPVRSGSRITAIVLILLGVFFLLQKRGLIPDLGPLVHAWWPVLLILAGVVILVRRGRRG